VRGRIGAPHRFQSREAARGYGENKPSWLFQIPPAAQTRNGDLPRGGSVFFTRFLAKLKAAESLKTLLRATSQPNQWLLMSKSTEQPGFYMEPPMTASRLNKRMKMIPLRRRGRSVIRQWMEADQE
jgi:hypothetical protein